MLDVFRSWRRNAFSNFIRTSRLGCSMPCDFSCVKLECIIELSRDSSVASRHHPRFMVIYVEEESWTRADNRGHTHTLYKWHWRDRANRIHADSSLASTRHRYLFCYCKRSRFHNTATTFVTLSLSLSLVRQIDSFSTPRQWQSSALLEFHSVSYYFFFYCWSYTFDILIETFFFFYMY